MKPSQIWQESRCHNCEHPLDEHVDLRNERGRTVYYCKGEENEGCDCMYPDATGPEPEPMHDTWAESRGER